MPWFTNLKAANALARLGREEQGAVALVVGLLLTGILALAAASIDLGVMYSAHGELQNAADAAALAAADTLVILDEDNHTVATPDVATSTAKTLAAANLAHGVYLDLPDQDIEMGYWQAEAGDFDPDRYGPSGNPDDLTAVRVTTRRDDTANSPVGTMLAGIIGLTEVDLSASSTAFLGYAGNVDAGVVDLPIAVHHDTLTGEDGAICGEAVEFHDQNNQNGSWTTFFVWPSNDPAVMDFIDGSEEIPPLEVGDIINVTNGNLSQNTFNTLMARFQAEGQDTDGDGSPDYWPVVLPVVLPGDSSAVMEISGFATMIITAVNDAPYKNVQGYLQCGVGIPNSQTGGGDYGTRATFSKLIQ